MEVRRMDMFGLYSKGDKIEPIRDRNQNFCIREVLIWKKKNLWYAAETREIDSE